MPARSPGPLASLCGGRRCSGQRAEDGADGAGVEALQAEGEGDQLVESFGHTFQPDSFQDGDVVAETGEVGRKIPGVE